jgi:ATP-dependent RNA helicase DeaD
MPKPIVALAKRYQRDALRISTISEDRGHGDISYQAVTVAPADIENAVVNLLRFHNAESAMLFCATRDNVRHLHASLIERGFSAVALSGEHSQSERNHALQALRDRRAKVCVATDVAARGIDLPTLSLVIHVELPRDAEALQHRSGRTGRAGKKGTAVLLVPYPRRRRVEMMLRGARIEAEWIAAPTPEDIRRNDRERLIEQLIQPVEADEEDKVIAMRVQKALSADAIAVALVQAHRAKMPAPEELLDGDARPARDQHKRNGFDDTVWFRLNIGRRHNADARWILPLLCRRGHITKNEVGAIKIAANETMFDIPRAVAARFADALKRTAQEDPDDGIMIEPVDGNPRMASRQNKRRGDAGNQSHHEPSGSRPPRAPAGDRPARAPSGDRPAFAPAGDRPHRAPGKPHGARPFRGKPKGRG